MNPITIGIAAIALSSCASKPDSDRLVAQCEMKARERFPIPTDYPENYDKSGPAADYVVACMKARGFRYKEGLSCPIGDISTFESRCYIR